MNKTPLIILTGPTAVGKTKLSLALAKNIGGEIISADSIQVYRGMDIGSAKLMPNEREGVIHHLIDVCEPSQSFDVVTFQRMAKEAIRKVRAANHIPIVVGGTGFYIQALLYDIDFTEHAEDNAYRKELEGLAAVKGNDYLYSLLLDVDPDAAKQIHPNNTKRVIRALEFWQSSGKMISEHNLEQQNKQSPYAFAYFVLNDERSKLYARIEQRIDEMMTDGLLDEVKRLKDNGCTKDLVSMQGLGYKELLSYLDGDFTLDEAIEIIKRDTRHFAKRQITWFKREKDVIWLEQEDYAYDMQKILTRIIEVCKERQVL